MTDIKFYRSPRWLSKRDSILRRDKYECQNCKRYFKTKTATTVHHIYFYEDYPKLSLVNWNLISLCSKCHNMMHNRFDDTPTKLGISLQEKKKKDFETWLYPPTNRDKN